MSIRQAASTFHRVAAVVLMLSVVGCGSSPKLTIDAACQPWAKIRPGVSGADPAKFSDQ